MAGGVNGGCQFAVHVTDPEGKTLFDHYTEFKVLLRHLEMHGGHIH
jgi:hypothetical protein